MDFDKILIAFGLTLFAGLSTGIGSTLAFFTKKTNTRFLSIALGFSAGVMIYVSMIEIFFKAKDSLVLVLGRAGGSWATLGAFFGGIFLIAVIDRFVPKAENPHEFRKVELLNSQEAALDSGNTVLNSSNSTLNYRNSELNSNDSADLALHSSNSTLNNRNSELNNEDAVSNHGNAASDSQNAVSNSENSALDHSKLMRMGMFTALAIAIHNFPEGLAAFTSAIKDPSLGIAIAIAIAIHNIPEGIAVSIPVYYATGDRKKAFKLSFLSGLSEPVGAVIGYIILYRFFNDVVFGILFAAVAGIMVFISLDELLPTAREYGEAHLSIYGLIAGMMVMGISLILFM